MIYVKKGFFPTKICKKRDILSQPFRSIWSKCERYCSDRWAGTYP